jgi:hypothetical protein
MEKVRMPASKFEKAQGPLGIAISDADNATG